MFQTKFLQRLKTRNFRRLVQVVLQNLDAIQSGYAGGKPVPCLLDSRAAGTGDACLYLLRQVQLPDIKSLCVGLLILFRNSADALIIRLISCLFQSTQSDSNDFPPPSLIRPAVSNLFEL